MGPTQSFKWSSYANAYWVDVARDFLYSFWLEVNFQFGSYYHFQIFVCMGGAGFSVVEIVFKARTKRFASSCIINNDRLQQTPVCSLYHSKSIDIAQTHKARANYHMIRYISFIQHKNPKIECNLHKSYLFNLFNILICLCLVMMTTFVRCSNKLYSYLHQKYL